MTLEASSAATGYVMRRMEIGRRELAWDPPQPVTMIGSNCYAQQVVGSIIAHAQPILFCFWSDLVNDADVDAYNRI